MKGIWPARKHHSSIPKDYEKTLEDFTGPEAKVTVKWPLIQLCVHLAVRMKKETVC